MATKTSKTPPNAVRTTNRLYTYYFDQLVMQGVTADKKGKSAGFYATKTEIRLAVEEAMKGNNYDTQIYTLGRRISYTASIADMNTNQGFFRIGCMEFSRTATVKIAKWAGVDSDIIKQFIVG